MGPYYTLLRFDRQVEVEALLVLAKARNVPLVLLDVESENYADSYSHKLLLARPDQHVAWRGDAVPGDAGELIDIIRGAAKASARAAA
jgi:hypothetical protein